MRMRYLASLALALTTVAVNADARGCAFSMPVSSNHMGLADGGGFDLAGTAFATSGFPGPPIRFWAHGHFAEASSGEQNQYNEADLVVWLRQPSVDYKLEGVKSTLWSLEQANWAGPKITKCIRDLELEDERTVVELSFADTATEGKTSHRGLYGILSVPFHNETSSFNTDQVRGGAGEGKNIVAMMDIPAPKVSGKGTVGSSGKLEVTLDLGKVVSYSEGGADKPAALIKGFRILYATGDEPTSSDPSNYKAVLNPKNTRKSLGTITVGTSSVTVAVPKGKKTWFVAQLVYDDPTEIVSNATSAHSGGVTGDGTLTPSTGSSRSRSTSGGRNR